MVKKRKNPKRELNGKRYREMMVGTCLHNMEQQFQAGETAVEQVAYMMLDRETDDQVAYMTIPKMLETVSANADKIAEICKEYDVPDMPVDAKTVRNSFMGNCRDHKWPHLLVSPTWMAQDGSSEADTEVDGVEIGNVGEAEIANMPNRVEIIICQLWLPGMGEEYEGRYAQIKRGADKTNIGELFTLYDFCKMLDEEMNFE
jgi:hypothetical protein